jgi:Ca2+-transporting ATPase
MAEFGWLGYTDCGFGRNELIAEEPVPAWRKFLVQFIDVVVILLLIAALVSAGLWLYERKSALPN